MALIHDIARLAHNGVTRADISLSLLIDRQVLDWLMDSDSFALIMENVSTEDVCAPKE